MLAKEHLQSSLVVSLCFSSSFPDNEAEILLPSFVKPPIVSFLPPNDLFSRRARSHCQGRTKGRRAARRGAARHTRPLLGATRLPSGKARHPRTARGHKGAPQRLARCSAARRGRFKASGGGTAAVNGARVAVGASAPARPHPTLRRRRPWGKARERRWPRALRSVVAGGGRPCVGRRRPAAVPPGSAAHLRNLPGRAEAER